MPAALNCLLLLGTLLAGCATGRHQFVGSRPFRFRTDTFAYANGLVWVYHYNNDGKWVHHRRQPPSDYVHHCFVVARSARQFFENARFDPDQPMAESATYRRLIRQVVSIDPRHPLPACERIVIPGYANLREFSQARERLLKDACGGTWQSYLQRGNWRMIFPFSRANQARAAQLFVADLKQNRPPVVHVVRFPQLTINHAILLFGAEETKAAIVFSVYDPNHPERPTTLTFDRATRTFQFPASNYFPGGRVDVYEVYRSWDY